MRNTEKNIDDAQRTIVGRVLDDYSYEWKCLYKAFFRFLCISRVTYMEYEQPYWTTHEHEYKDELIKRKIEEK